MVDSCLSELGPVAHTLHTGCRCCFPVQETPAAHPVMTANWKKVLVPRPCEQWFWVTPPLWLNPHHKAEDWSRSLLGLELVVTWCCFFPPFLPCGLFVWYCTRQRYCRLLYCMFSIHGQQSEVYLSALNCYTTEKYVMRCPEMFPLIPLPACQNKYLIWKSRYRSQLDCTKGPVSLLLLLLLF